ncbi:MarR family winged helix-turn-helix transcriptional regulator [Symbioplanes lichenis]|uniref:MarR family winged helix-turn-helix transcriptional regulator n=1 Tax=Symbioplanes lichenis TaxID=1629072 RepID=UPI0027395BA3|nr:MarR family transcriptional regulator [Actinoplanes lichenis]
MLRELFDDLIRLEIVLWNTIDTALRRECDASMGSFDVLSVIERTPECRVQEVAGQLVITVGGASQAVDRIERKGWCVRRPHPRNRRSSVLELTEEGRRVYDTAAQVFEREAQRLLGEPLTDGERAQFGAMLRRLRAAATS